ncbi:hypothetical protein BGW36DRAFT_425525 [Talaromyces proteolyticus]|uniref:Uncharacterized protein n=1 Tax=Talaromyces proteolyticus TaxID=1131652 RepID=A0AAD4KVG1_9EURO|nr:uncharacterized protein BGW36DRAFT_425525 [Talaromyces proteolyticus]KAH8700711.1 hypothetical protein BGW36DRAFT_425525 [Talaromyces proteolyticus]
MTSLQADDDSATTIGGESPTASHEERPYKFLVALDFGTANTSVSYLKFDPKNPPTRLHSSDIKSIRSWPNSPSKTNHTNARSANVPSESWYLNGEYLWGYSVRRRIQKPQPSDTITESKNVIKFSKLLLQDGGRSFPWLIELLHRINKTPHEVIKDYLIQIFMHTKNELKKHEDFKDSSAAVDLVICIPAGWSSKAQIDMQIIMQEVAKEVDFGYRDFEPFIIHEPDAAAAHLLEALEGYVTLEQGETFIICDAGGGTVDATTYRVKEVNPYRFKEVIHPAGLNCGSSYINDRLAPKIKQRLQGETYLEEIMPIDFFVQEAVSFDFEYQIKYEFTYEEYLGQTPQEHSIRIFGLREDEQKNFGTSILNLECEEIAECFKDSIEDTVSLLKQQVEGVEAIRGYSGVQKILLVGGFSQSPALRRKIEEEFAASVVYTDLDMSSIVSHGAVFRALNKKNGPERKIAASIGVLTEELFDSNNPGHWTIPEGTHSHLDGEHWARDLIDWHIKKHAVLKAKQSSKRVLFQRFEEGEEWEIRQRLYLSDQRVKDSYYCHSAANQSAIVAGVLKADLSELKNTGQIQKIEAVAANSGPYYEFHYELELEVDGRNLTVRLIYPPGGYCYDETRICIAAYFKAGTE